MVLDYQSAILFPRERFNNGLLIYRSEDNTWDIWIISYRHIISR
jgi:hypothetical protein